MNSDSRLRAKAELQLQERIESENLTEGKGLQEVIQELRIHQIELEMQNDELQKAQASLESSRDRYKELYEFAPVGIFTCDPDGTIIAANAMAGRLLGVPRSDLLGTSFARFSTQTDKDTYYHHARAVLAGDCEKSCTIQMIHSDGRKLLTDMKSNVESISGKKCIRTSLLDISDREDMEARLHLASRAIENTADGIVITDADSNIVSVNRAFEHVTGYSQQEVVGKRPQILSSGKQSKAFYQEMWESIKDKGQWQGKLWNRKKNGEEYPEQLSITTVLNHDGVATNYVGVFSDISDKISLEEQLRQSQKMEAIGTLVGGIAHDFNNMLAGITGNLYLAEKLAEHSPDLLKKLANIDQLSNRAATMISHMLTFARKGIVQMHAFSFNSLVKEIINLSHVSVPENINFHYQIENDDLMIHGDETQLQQVIMNLLNNARDAVAAKRDPDIELSLTPFIADEAFRYLHPELVTDHLVHLCVRDNGCGISEDTQGMIFDPFFTTKEVGMGTGLGLSMCYGAIRSHHGIIDVESTIGKGSAFHVYLPLLEEEPAAEDTAAIGEKVWQAHGETLLLADDEDCIRETVSEVLEEFGYRVLQASDGKKALELFEAHQKEIRLAILDVVMPYMGGPQLAEKLRKMSPDLPILFATGYDKLHVIDQSMPVNNSEIITKPFQLNKFVQLIRKLMA